MTSLRLQNYYRTLEVDVLLGGGQNIYKENMLEEHRCFGYQIAKTSGDLKKVDNSKKVLGLFAGGHLPMTIDWLNQKSLQRTVPTLAEMTAKALEMLGASDRFILQVEGGRVDHACHGSDAPGAIYDHLAFDDAIQVALDYQKEHPETLIVVTADHGCGGPSLNGMGSGYGDTPKLLLKAQKARGSFEALTGGLRKCERAPQVQDYIEKNYEIKLTAEQANWLLLARDGRHSDLRASGRLFKSVGPDAGQSLRDQLGFEQSLRRFRGADGQGSGAERFKGLIRNTDIFDHYLDFAGLRFRNKQWTGVTAQAEPVSMTPHWLDTQIA